MKEVIYTDRAKEDPKAYAALQEVTRILERVTARLGEEVTAEWDRTRDPHGGPAYVLRLSDWTGAASAVLGPNDLQPTNVLWARLYSLWGDLLQIRSHRLVREMLEAAATANGEE